ncbi:7 transmembrane sweet-taste receptor of 3 GCPR-domain-containing protein [Globomyces pollinis-pini]|nr:7 transmembrane sweet-taste receptor of 3 GCPR-domain-containing protein [Globomyces pollinis-pini]
MQICLLLANSQFLLMIDKPTPVKCTIDSFVIPVLFSFYYGLLFAKNLRIYRIFYYPLTKKFLNQNFVYFLAFMFTLPSGVTSIIWNVFDPPIPTIVSPFQNQYYWTCKSARGMESIAIGIHIILNTLVLVANLGMAFMTRNVVSTYSETKMIGLSVYNMTVISIFDIVMLSSESLGFNAKYLVKTISILYVILFNLTTTFLYKVYQVHTDAKLSSTISNVEKPKPVAIVNKDGNVVESLVSVTEVGRYMNQSYEGLFRVMSPDCAMIFKRKKTSLESQITKDDGFGTGWFVSKLTKFACMERSPLIHRFYIDEKTYDIKYQTAEETAIWTQFFKSWSYRVQPDNMSVSSPSKQLSVI